MTEYKEKIELAIASIDDGDHEMARRLLVEIIDAMED